MNAQYRINRTQHSDIHLFDINYKYIIPLHKKNNMY